MHPFPHCPFLFVPGPTEPQLPGRPTAAAPGAGGAGSLQRGQVGPGEGELGVETNLNLGLGESRLSIEKADTLYQRKKTARCSHCGTVGYEFNYSSSGHCGGSGSIPGLTEWVKSSVATATAQIQSLAWELTCATGAAKKKKKKNLVHQLMNG